MSRLVVAAAFLFSPAGADDRDRVAALTKVLNHGSDKARVEAARELGKVGGQQAIAALTERLDAENEILRHAVALALVTSGSKESDVIAVLRTSLRAKAWYRRWDAVRALTLVGQKARPAVPDLIRVFEARDALLSREAALALAQIAPGSDAVVVALFKSLDRRDTVRGAVLGALKAIRAQRRKGRGDRRSAGKKVSAVLPWLVRHIKSSARPDPHNRDFDLLVALGPHPTALYVDLLDTESPRIRAAVLAGLRQVGPRARRAIPAICAWFVNPNDSVRMDARAALRAIGAGSLCDLISWRDQEAGTSRLAVEAGPVLALDLWLWRDSRRLIRILEDKTIGEQTRRELAKVRLTAADQRRLAAAVSNCLRTRNIRCGLLLVSLLVESPEDAASVARKFTEHKSEAVRNTARDALRRIKQRNSSTKGR